MRYPFLDMAKRHFEYIAATIAALPAECSRDDVAKAFARSLNYTNPNFQPDKFREACQPKAEAL